MKKFSILLIACLPFIFSGCSNAYKEHKETIIEISTDYGNIVIKLYDETPKHRDNFIKLIEEGWFENSPFHRVIESFVIQGGGNAEGQDDPGYTIDAEFLPQYFHKRGALGAARQPDDFNPNKESSGSQFYICQGRTYTESEIVGAEARSGYEIPEEHREVYKTVGGIPHLDGNYTVFGEVIEGMDVVDKIAAVETKNIDMYRQNVPVEDVLMTIRIIKK